MSPCSNVCATERNGFVVMHRTLSTERCGSTRRCGHGADPNCGWHDCARTRQDGQSMADSVQSETTESRLRFCRCDCNDWQGTGESLNRLPVVPHELILADAGYCSIAGIEHVRQQGADVLLRVNPQSFVPFSPQGSRISLLSRLRTLSTVGQCGEWRVILRGQDSSFEGRLCALRKNDSAVEQARRRLHPRASQKQMITRPETVELAKYVLLFTTKFSGSTAQVLEFYRMRWQIELVFKRLKSLVQMGHVPKHDDCSSRPWLYGKLLIALLTQKLIRIGHDMSPAAIDFRPQRPPSPWREFSFALRNIQQAIEPDVSLGRVLLSWNEIARALAEESRRRVLQAQIVNQAIVQMGHGSSYSRFVIS